MVPPTMKTLLFMSDMLPVAMDEDEGALLDRNLVYLQGVTESCAHGLDL